MMWRAGADAQWSHRCSTGIEREAPHWSFYIFGLQEPLVPHLEQFDVTTTALPEETLQQAQQLLQSRLTARYGPPEDRSPKFVRSRAVPCPEYMHWQAGDVVIDLNVSELDPQRKDGRLLLQGRHRPLLAATNDSEPLTLVGTTDLLYAVGAGIDAQVADNLRTDFPAVAVMLMTQQPDPDPPNTREAIQQWQSQRKAAQSAGQTGVGVFAIALPPNNSKPQELHDALVRLLTTAKTSPPDR